MLVEGKAGPVTGQDGAFNTFRLSRDASQVIQDSHGHFQEAVYRGSVFSAGTAVAGVALGTAVGATAAYTLYNPKGSGKLLVPLVASLATPGTMAANTPFYVVNSDPAGAAVTGTALTSANNFVGAAASGVGKPFSVATVPTGAAQVAVRPFCNIALYTSGTTTGLPFIVKDLLDGEFVIGQGCALSVTGVGTATTAALSMAWEEITL